MRRLHPDRSLYACAECRSAFCVPFRAPPPEFYERAGDLASTSRHSERTEWYRDHPSRRSRLFSSGRGGRLLDIGCGNGAFAEFASRAGYRVTGLDVDAASLAVAHSRGLANADFRRGLLDDHIADLPEGEFDVVSMFEVFEHLEQPLAVLEQVKKLLRPGGMFVGSLPNTERLLMWQLYMDYEMPPYHLTYWTEKGWKHFLSRNGFDVLDSDPTIYFGYASDVLMYKHGLPRVLQSVVGRILRPLEVAFERRNRIGASFYFEAERTT
ncbi:MAG: class I SAM-dependent methyltransferase [Polyangiales bacterium]